MFVRGDANHTIIIEKSRFICYLRHCRSEAEYLDFLAVVRKKHFDASHVASAYIGNKCRRSSDDKEPAGTAGVPILMVLEKNGLSDTAALVVRYFGGIKLGAGGLIRAYSQAVSEAIKEAEIAEEVFCPKYRLTLSYADAEKIRRYLSENTAILDTAYEEEVSFTFLLLNDNLKTICEYTKGLEPEYLGEEAYLKVIQ